MRQGLLLPQITEKKTEAQMSFPQSLSSWWEQSWDPHLGPLGRADLSKKHTPSPSFPHSSQAQPSAAHPTDSFRPDPALWGQKSLSLELLPADGGLWPKRLQQNVLLSLCFLKCGGVMGGEQGD